VDGIEQQYGDQLNIVRLDFTSARGQALAARYRVSGHPTIVLLDDAGRVQTRIFGVPQSERLQAAVQTVLAGK